MVLLPEVRAINSMLEQMSSLETSLCHMHAKQARSDALVVCQEKSKAARLAEGFDDPAFKTTARQLASAFDSRDNRAYPHLRLVCSNAISFSKSQVVDDAKAWPLDLTG